MPIFVKDKPPVQGSGAPARPALPRSRSALLWQAAAALAGGVLAAGQVYGGAAPFGLALVMGCAPGYLLPAAVGAALGSLLALPMDLALKLMGAILAAAMARLAGRQLRREETRLAVGAGSGALLLEQGIVGLGSGLAVSPGSNAAVLGTAVLAAGLGLAIHAFPTDKPRGACLWLAMLTACAQRLTVGGFAPGLALAAAGGLCAAYAGSLEQSAVLAVALAAALTAATPGLAYGALAVALGTLGAAAFCAGRRWSCAGVFVLGCGLGALAAPGWFQAAGILAGAASGVLLYILTPPALLRALFPPPARRPPARASRGQPGGWPPWPTPCRTLPTPSTRSAPGSCRPGGRPMTLWWTTRPSMSASSATGGNSAGSRAFPPPWTGSTSCGGFWKPTAGRRWKICRPSSPSAPIPPTSAPR